jgi:hypothetical protein
MKSAAGSDVTTVPGLFTTPADPVAKSIARNVRRGGPGQVEAEEPVAPSPMAAAS